MFTLFWTLFTRLCLALLSLRYKIEVKGLENLSPERLNRKGGILFLPNHPAHMDPLFLFLLLWPKFRMRPLEIEYVYRLPFLQPWNRLVKAIPIPNFETSINELKVKKAGVAVRQIAEGLKERENFILYPAGRLKSVGKELLGGSSGAHAIIQECPNANVVLIRTTGLWGSSFSRALLGRSPEIMESAWHGVKLIFKNFIFFTPRRKILIEIESNPQDLPRKNMTRIELNRYLENWYNRYKDEGQIVHETEPLKLVSYSRWKNELPEPYKPKKRRGTNGDVAIPDVLRKKVYQELRRILENPKLEIKDEMSLAFDLGMDSLNIAEFIAFLTKNYDIPELHPEELESVRTVLEIIEGGIEAIASHHPVSTHTWPEEEKRPAPDLPNGRIMSEAFLNSALRMGDYPACGDEIVGVLSYKKLRKGALVLAQYFKTWEENHVAVLLPSSAGAYIVILALQLAGKVPVMLNWTLGSRYLEEMMKVSGCRSVVSSWRFLDNLSHVQFGNLSEKLVLLEDIRSSLSLKMKLKGLFLSFCSPKHILKSMDLNKIDENSPCVILFTSGTEAVPKGVPLSHKNIITNQRSAMQCIELRSTDVMYGILPPFHSFGFSVAGLFPILSGMKVAFYPDPTDSFALAEGVSRWKVTLFCSAPSFLKGLFNAAKDEQLKTIRIFVSGAEKAPKELFDRVKKLNSGGKLVEGYGITECSPIITLNRFNMPPKGVGRLIPDIEMRTIHPETLEPQPQGAEGEICVRGPNVFSGYLGNPRNPFIEIEGKQWYRTGDLGYLDPDGSLILSGRLKRFTKIGGEMISLGAIEEVLVHELLKQGRISPDVPSIAICSDEKEEERTKLVLFAVIDLEKEEANQMLLQAGFSNLVKVSAVKKVDEIPLMGAGKTNYRALQSQINS